MQAVPVNTFKRALAEGRPQIGLWSVLPSPYISEMLGGAGFDWVLLDAEHTPTDVPQMLAQLQAMAGAIPLDGTQRSTAVVRPPWNDTVLIKRYLDIGAQTLLLPFVQSAAEATAAVRAIRYAPAGVRGMGGSVRASNFGRIKDYIETANDELCLLVQVETREALERLESIANVDGIDGVFIGPSDLAASMGHPGNPNHPEVRAAVADAIDRIRACGKAAGILVVDEAWARECLDRGALFVAVGVDLLLLARGAEAMAARFKPSAGAPVKSSY